MSFSGLSQNKRIDSLLHTIKTIKDPTVKAKTYRSISYNLIDIDLDKAFIYNDSSYILSQKEDYQEGIASAYNNYCILHRASGNYDKALEYLSKYDKLIIGDTLKIAGAAMQRGILNSIKGNYDKSIKNYLIALTNYELLGNERGMGVIYNTIGITYSNVNRYDEAIHNFEKSISILETLNDYTGLSSTYVNLANVYDYLNKDEKALEYFTKSIELSEKTSNIRRIARNKQNISSIFEKQKKYDKALLYAEEAYSIIKQNNYKGELVGAAAALGNIHLLMGNFKKSEAILLEQMDSLKGSATDQQNIYNNLYKLYQVSNNDKKALEYHKKYKRISDRLINEKALRNLDNLQIKYETERKDKEILAQNLALEKSQSKTQIMTILLITLLLASILLWFLFQQRQKRIQQQLITIQKEQEVLTLESLIAGEEKERLRIAQELHDGVNGDLSAIKFKLSSLLKMNNEVINEAVSMIDNSCQQVRAISHNLVPPSLQDFKLQEAIANYCENMDNSNKPAISFQHIGATLDFNKKAEVNILRIVQELVTNAIKHAQASEITVQTSLQEGTMQLSVEDNGVGYDVNLENSNGIGLQNIKSRVAYLDGDIDVVSNKNGTEYTITFNPDNAS